MNETTDVLRLNPDDKESREFRLLIDPSFDFTLNRTPTQTGSDGKHLLGHGAALGYRTTATRSLLYVHFDERKIDNQIYATTSKLEDDGSISSWRDLYGAELIVQLPQTAPAGARITRCTLTFSNGAQIWVQDY